MAMLGMGAEVTVRLPGTISDAVPGTWTPSVQGPQPPAGYKPTMFNCPEGSDFDASQEVGMCVAKDYSPVYSQSSPGGPRVYYNLDGSVGGTDAPSRPLIPGVPNAYVYVGVGVLALIFLLRGRR